MARRQKKYHYIYKTTCNVNGKYYIGMHSTDNLEDGYLGSGKRLFYSINYYGKYNHTKKILEYCDTREELKKREREIVNEQLINEHLCMNIKTGGEGGFTSEEHKHKFILNSFKSSKTRNKAHKNSLEKRKILYENGEWVTKWKENISKGLKNNPLISGGTFTNKQHTEETKRKIGEKNSLKQKGEKNSQYGTFWITDGKKNKKIKKNESIPNGWSKGRTLI